MVISQLFPMAKMGHHTAHKDMCLHNILKCPRFNYINEHRKTNRHKAQFLNKNIYIQISLCIGLRSKRTMFPCMMRATRKPFEGIASQF